MSENESHYCICISEALQDSNDRAALLNESKWPSGEVITATFVEGDPSLQDRVRKVALEWVAPGMANLQINFVESGPADIRIAFVQGDGSWSYLGTICRKIPEGQPTMNYGWLTTESEEAEVRRVVLHEFGHALGLIHEHQNPSGGINWNEPAVLAECAKPPNEWDEETTRHNILNHYPQKEVTATTVDPLSIMMYPIPQAWTLDGFSAGLNSGLSEHDIAFIKETYPKE